MAWRLVKRSQFMAACPLYLTHYGVVTVVDATTFSYALLSDPGPWVTGGALQTLTPTVYDDVRIVHALTVDAGEAVSLNSFSLETSTTYGTSTTTTTVGTLSLDGDFGPTAETTTLQCGGPINGGLRQQLIRGQRLVDEYRYGKPGFG